MLTQLFHPRNQTWREHFRCDEGKIQRLTEVGRTTAHFLKFNAVERVTERIELANAGIVFDSHLSKKPR